MAASPRSISRAAAVRGAGAVAAASALPAAIVPSAAHGAAVRVVLDGRPLELDPAAQLRGGDVFVPLRAVCEQLGAHVHYRGGSIDVRAAGRSATIRVGSRSATVRGRPHRLAAVPFVRRGRAFVPLAFVEHALGVTAAYDPVRAIAAIARCGKPGAAA